MLYHISYQKGVLPTRKACEPSARWQSATVPTHTPSSITTLISKRPPNENGVLHRQSVTRRRTHQVIDRSGGPAQIAIYGGSRLNNAWRAQTKGCALVCVLMGAWGGYC